MKSFIITVMLVFAAFFARSQGIEFQRASFEDVSRMAEKEGKLIFVDFYTVWCGPCKGIARNVFPQPKVGAYFNSSFISIQLDAEKEGRALARKYQVTAYPTLMFLDPKGEVMNKHVGSIDAEALIAAGKDAQAATEDADSYIRLKAAYPLRKDDEQFLLKYIAKMTEVGEEPIGEIERYLKIQKSIKESDVEMMEFLFKYSSKLILGGKTEEIFNANFNEYMDIATRAEVRKLNGMRRSMLMLTRTYALKKNDTTLFRVFMDRWLTSSEKNEHEDYNSFRLDLTALKRDTVSYKRIATQYLDSLCASKTVEQVGREDKEAYAKFLKDNPHGFGLLFESRKRSMMNVYADLYVKSIYKIGNQYVRYSRKNEDLTDIFRWIEYGKKLLPDYFLMTNLEANALYAQGKLPEALQVKQKSIDMLDQGDRNRGILEIDLKTWRKQK